MNSRNAQLSEIKATDALAGITQYGYNGVDHLLSVTDPKSLITSYSVDGLDNQKQLISPDTGAANSTYDGPRPPRAAGNLKTRSDARAKISTYNYDALNRVSGVTFSDTTRRWAISTTTRRWGMSAKAG